MYKTLILLSLICSSVFAQTVSSFVEETTPAPADLLYLVKTPGGPGTSRKVTAANLTKALTAASATDQGVITTGAQTFAGLKTFPIDISFGDILHPGGIRDIFVGHTNGIFCEAVTGSNNSIHIWLSQSTDNSLAPTFNGYKSRGTVASKTPPITGDDLISFRGLVHTTTGGSSSLPAAQIFFEVGTGTVSTTSTPGRIVMATAKDGSTTNSRRLEIDGDQIVINDSSTDGVVFRVETNNDANAIVTDAVNDRVGIGTATPGAKLEVNGETISQGDITIGTGLIKNPGAGTLDMILTAINDGGTGRVIVQSATDFRFLNHFGSTMFEVDEASRVGIGGGSQPSKMLTVSIDAANRIGQEIKLAASQTANALEVNSLAGSGGDLFVVNALGNIGVGISPTAKMSTMGVVNTSGFNRTLNFRHPNVSHGFTSFAPHTDEYGYISAASTSRGGLAIGGFSDAGNGQGITFNSIQGATTTTVPAFQYSAGKWDGVTGVQQLANSESLLQIYNAGTTLPFEILGGGTTTVTASTPELSVLNLKTTATNDDPTVETSQGRIATTDATVTTIRTIPITASKTYKIKADIIARRTGGTAGTADDGASYTREWSFTTKAGTVTQLGADGEIFTAEDQAGWNVDATISTTNVLIQVTGAVDNTVTWHLSKCEISSVGS